MSQFLTFKTSKKTSKALRTSSSPQTSINATARAVQFVLMGTYSSVSDAFAHDKHTLDMLSKIDGDPVVMNRGVMAGAIRQR